MHDWNIIYIYLYLVLGYCNNYFPKLNLVLNFAYHFNQGLKHFIGLLNVFGIK